MISNFHVIIFCHQFCSDKSLVDFPHLGRDAPRSNNFSKSSSYHTIMDTMYGHLYTIGNGLDDARVGRLATINFAQVYLCPSVLFVVFTQTILSQVRAFVQYTSRLFSIKINPAYFTYDLVFIAIKTNRCFKQTFPGYCAELYMI